MNNIEYGIPTLPGRYRIKTSQKFDALLGESKRVISENGLWVIAEINPQALLEKAGYAISEARQILFFHPDFMVKLLAHDPSAVVAVPLKVVLVKLPDGQVIVQVTDPLEVFEKFPKLKSLAEELNNLSDKIFQSIIKGSEVL